MRKPAVIVLMSLILAGAAVADTSPPPAPSANTQPGASQSGYGSRDISASTASELQSSSASPFSQRADASFSGDFQWRYPIDLPPGTNGVQPKLALTYNSSAPNGILGEGFFLEGLSSIERDASRGPIAFSSTDTFVLDGQRLYWNASDSCFHFERETYDRIQVFTDNGGTTPTGDPNGYNTYWVVYKKDGTKLTYGKNSGRIYAIGTKVSGPQIFRLIGAWALERVEDPLGNYYSISYDGSPGAVPFVGQTATAYRPTKIVYTKNDIHSLSKWKEVTFTYEDRPDKAPTYTPTRIDPTSRLKTIAINYAADEAGVRLPDITYTISYGSSKSNQSHITSIQPSAADGSVLPKVNLGWATTLVDPTAGGFDVRIPVGTVYQKNLAGGFSTGNKGAKIIPGDFNGDGKTDFIRQEYGSWADGSSQAFQLYLAGSTTGSTGEFSIKTPTTPPVSDTTHYADYQHSLAASFSAGTKGATIIPGDFNGDGRTDFIRQEWGTWADDNDLTFQVFLADSTTSSQGRFRVWTPKPPTSDTDHYAAYQSSLVGSSGSGGKGANIIPGDFNGDGRMDFIRQEWGTWADDYNLTFQVFLADDTTDTAGTFFVKTPTGDEYQHNLVYKFSTGTRGCNIIPGDFNGDGKTDFIRQEKGTWADDGHQAFQVYFATGGGSFTVVTPGDNPYRKSLAYSTSSGGGVNIIPGDFNGDGKMDFIRQERASSSTSTTAFQVFLSKGDGTFDIKSDTDATLQHSLAYGFATGTGGAVLTVGDFNGDGLADFVRQEQDSPSTNATAFQVFLSRGDGTFFRMTPSTADFQPRLAANLASPATGSNLFVGDFDGNGKTDFIGQEYGQWADDNAGSFKVFYVNSLENSAYLTGDMLTKIDLPTGGSIQPTYVPIPKIPVVSGVSEPVRPSASSYPASVALASSRPLVTSVKFVPNITGETGVETTYQYYDGRYMLGYSRDRTDLGFQKVTRTTNGTRTVATFSQDEPTQGLVLSQSVASTQGNLFTQTIMEYFEDQPFSALDDVHFIAPKTVWVQQYDGQNTSFLERKLAFEYQSGNVTKITNYGVANGTTGSAPVYPQENTIRKENTYEWPNTSYISRLVSTQVWASDATKAEAVASETKYYYDGSDIFKSITNGLLTAVVQKLSASSDATATTKFTYDDWGNPTSQVDPSNVVLFQNTYDTDYHSLLKTTTDSAGLTTTANSWNSLLQPTSVSDSQTNTWQFAYDGFGRPTKNVVPLARDSLNSPTENVSYADVPTRSPWSGLITTPASRTIVQKTKGANTLGGVTYLDGLGRTLQTKTQTTVNGQWVTVDRYYDASGRVSSVSNPYTTPTSDYSWAASNLSSQKKTTYTYDALGRVTKTTHPDLTVTQTAYARATTSTLDELGHLVQIDNLGNQVIERTYTGSYTAFPSPGTTSNLYTTTKTLSFRGEQRIVDTHDNTISVLFDLAGRKTQYIDPDMGTWTYQYNLNGSLSQQTDAAGNITAFDYDTAGRVTAKKQGSTVVAAYTYGTAGWQNGLLESVALAGSPYLNYTYDQLGRVTAVTKNIGTYGSRTMNLGYDGDGRLLSKQFPSGESLSYDYSPEGELRVLAGNSTYLSAVELDEFGRVKSRSWGNGTATGYTFDDVTFRPKTVTTPGILDLTYSYFDNGNIKAKTDGINAANNETYTYDDQNRLDTAVGAYGTRDYIYDELNNLLGMNGVAVNTYNTVGARPHAIIGDGTYTYAYDTNGNMTARLSGGVTDRSYVYDAENRLTAATVNGTETAYAYDDTRQRTTMTVGNKTTVFWFAGYEEIYVSGALNESVRSYFVNGQKFAQTSSLTGTSYVYSDLLGSTSKVRDSLGNVTANIYEPFGKLFSTTVNGVREGFTGQEWDGSSDLYYYNARYYSASLGRFVQPDTLLDGLNRYAYVQNNPVNFTDPTGMYTFSPAPGVSINTTTGTVTTPSGSYGSPSGSGYSPYHGPGVESSRNGHPFVGFDNNGRALYSLGSKSGSHFDHNTVDGLAVWALDGQLNSDAGNSNNIPTVGKPGATPRPSGPGAKTKKMEVDLFGIKVAVNPDIKSGNFNASIVFPSVKTEEKATLFGNDDLAVGLKGTREIGVLQARIGLTDGSFGFMAESTAASVGMGAFASILGTEVSGGGSVKSGSVGFGVEVGPSTTVFAGLGYGFDVNFSLGFK